MTHKNYVIVVQLEDGSLTSISEDEVNELDLNLEHGYDVDSIIAEVLKKRMEIGLKIE